MPQPPLRKPNSGTGSNGGLGPAPGSNTTQHQERKGCPQEPSSTPVALNQPNRPPRAIGHQTGAHHHFMCGMSNHTDNTPPSWAAPYGFVKDPQANPTPQVLPLHPVRVFLKFDRRDTVMW
ncbi:hypothetical protein CRENBAI_015262 [Crenichthys baileyi]|uniref:Uncharacterized protein n=1 Tax=Crenichthys baileyi TaxID=28760 RepID=A0AAV9SJZ8_9TELE